MSLGLLQGFAFFLACFEFFRSEKFPEFFIVENWSYYAFLFSVFINDRRTLRLQSENVAGKVHRLDHFRAVYFVGNK
jgi:hypothetical protein